MISCAPRNAAAEGPAPRRVILRVYRSLLRSFGPQHWWPGDTPFEVIVGAILTQNTNWTNVEKAIRNLKAERVLGPRSLRDIPVGALARIIRPSGYFNIKARRLKNFIQVLFRDYGGSLARMGREPLDVLRKKLLSINGIGPETADSIALYAFGKPSFVVDAYTKRIFSRHRIVPADADYEQVKSVFEGAVPPDERVYNEYHALIVRLAKDFCVARRPRCGACPLSRLNRDVRYSYDGERG